MQLRIHSEISEQFLIYFLNHGARQYLVNNETIVLSLNEGDSITLMQDSAMTKLWKVFIAIGVFLTAPLQLAYVFFLGQEKWNHVTLFRIRASLRALNDSTCCFTVKQGETQFQPPQISLSGTNVTLMEQSCEAAPWVFWDAYFVYSCRVISGMLWILGLMGYLFAIGLIQKNLLGTLVAGIVSLVIISVAVGLLKYAKNKCARKVKLQKELNQ